MKLKLNFKESIILFLIIILLQFNASFNFTSSFAVETFEKPNLVSQAAILMDTKTEKILYSKNENKKMYPASTTKIVTAILTLENCNLDEVVTVSYDTVMSIPDGYSSAFLQIGEQLTVEQLLQLLLVHSANDAANCLAEYVGGSIESFVSMMNTKVHEIGLSNTHFTNSFGMHDDNHYTTAQDLASIMKYCIKNENFRKLAGSASCAIPATNKYITRKYASTNELIIPNNSNYYSYLTSGKTGYTSQAGDCLVSSSYKDGLELICVILGGKMVNGVSTRFSETKDLYQYGYDNYSIRTLLNANDVVTQIEVSNGTKDTKNLDLLSSSSINVLLENTIAEDELIYEINLKKDIEAPIDQDDNLGSVSYTIDGIEYKADLIASHSVKKSKLLNYIFEIAICFFILSLTYKIISHKNHKLYKPR